MQAEYSLQEYLDVMKSGIKTKFQDQKPKKVVIVGAGMAGLVAGYELKRAGHTPVILEAQQRVGGRIYTLRDPFMEGLYAEAGAMRIPRAHQLTLAYIKKFGLCTEDFTMENPNAYFYIGGRKIRICEADIEPSLLGFELGEQERGQTAGRLWLAAIKPLLDLPIRNLYYPDHGRETGRGVILASYTWSEDAQRWGSLSPKDRIEQALENVAQIHPQILQEFEVGASWMWHDDEFSGGAFALFDPGQQMLLHEEIIKPEGRIYFAGEHASLYHAWIQGAIESGLRAAISIHQLP